MNEPNLVRRNSITDRAINKQKKILIIAVFCVITLFISSSYALLTNFDKTDNVITIKSGNLTVTVAADTINLNNKLPESDESGLQGTASTITLTNSGTMNIEGYDVKLVSETGTANVSNLDSKYIKYAISLDGTAYTKPKLLSSNNNIIYTGYNLAVNASKTIYLKVWIDNAAGNNAVNKSFYGSVKVDLYQKKDMPGTEKIKSSVVYEGDGLVAVNTAGTRASKTDTIREYRYSGTSNYCTYTDGTKDYNLTVSSSTCPTTACKTDDNTRVYFKDACSSVTLSLKNNKVNDGTVKNYIKFNNELWRIIGIFNEKTSDGTTQQLLKIVRNDYLTDLPTTITAKNTFDGVEVTNTYKFSSTINNKTAFFNYYTDYDYTGNSSDWTRSGMMHYLNDIYYNSFATEHKNMVESVTYSLGNSPTITTPIETYNAERDITAIHSGSEATWTGKIGLMYPSDYGYATNSDKWNTTITYDENEDAAGVLNWMYTHEDNKNGVVYYLISPCEGDTSYITAVTDSITLSADFPGLLSGATIIPAYGDEDTDVTDEHYKNYVRPSIYLKSTVKITGGDGTKSNPFTISL